MEYDYIKSKKILLVDDESELLQMVEDIFRQAGFQNLLTAATCREAVRIAREEKPDLAVLDVMLSDGDGFGLLQSIRAFTDIPVIYLTAKDEAEDKYSGLELGADDYLVKPFLPKELLLRTSAVLRRCYKEEQAAVRLHSCLVDFGRAEAYFISKRRILKHTDPILQAVDELSRGKPVSVKIPGELKPIGERLNRTSEILKNKNQARANWIQGISHDIRTPLSMIMGFADQISTEIRVPEDQKKKARIIRSQSVRIRELIKVLNLVYQLEYEMQPVMLQPVKIASLLREVAAEYLNEGLEEKYRLCPELPADTAFIEVQGDKRLLKRAVRNLVSNSINHNPQGCQITIRLETEDRHCKVVIQDNGTGLSEQELNDLRKRPRYLSSTDERLDLRYGIGLHLVRQIMDIHKARMVITSEAGNGVQTALLFQTLS